MYNFFGLTTTLQTVSVKLPKKDLLRIPARNRSGFIREAVHEKLSRDENKQWTPKTSFGKKLAAMRAAHISSGAELLSHEQVLEEIRQRRGGLA